MLENEAKQSMDKIFPSTVRASTQVATGIKCAHAYIRMETAWSEAHISPCSLLSCVVSMTLYSAGHSDRR